MISSTCSRRWPPPETRALQASLDALRRLKDGELIKGLDKTRPLGIAASLPEKQGDAPSVVAALPVTDFAQLLESLTGLGMKVEENPGNPGFSHKVSTPDGDRTVFALSAKRYAFFSLIPAGADQIRALDPASWKAKAGAGSVLGMTVRISKIPGRHEGSVHQRAGGLAGPAERSAGDEPEAEYKSRMVTTRLGKTAIASLVREGETLELDLNLDRGRDEISLNLDVSARPGTAMAESLLLQQAAEPVCLAGFGIAPGGVGELAGSQGVPGRPGRAPRAGPQGRRGEGEDRGGEEPDRPPLRAPQAEHHRGGDGHGMGHPGSHKTPSGQVLFGLIGGIKVGDGKQLERLVRDAIAKQPPAEEDLKVTFDAAKGDDGTPIHQLAIPESKLDAEMVKKIGKSPIFVAFAGNAVVVSMGEGGLKAIQQAPGTSPRSRPVRSPSRPRCEAG